jgi:hypothetical protein
MKSHTIGYLLSLLLGIFVGCKPDIDNPVLNTTNLEIISPVDGERIYEPKRIKVNFNPSPKNTKILFYIDRALMYADSTSPFEYYWNSGFWAGQNVEIKVRYEDTEKEIVAEKIVHANVSSETVKGPQNLSPPDRSILKSTYQLILQWSPVQTAQTYQIQLSNSEGFEDIYREITISNNGTFLDLLKIGNYYWRVRYKDEENHWTDWNNPSYFSYVFANGDFEMGDFTGWTLEEADQNSITLSNFQCFNGNYCAKTTLYPGDEVNNGHRVELVRYDYGAYENIKEYEFAYKFDLNYVDNPSWMIIQQFHDLPDFPNGETWNTHTIGPPPVFLHYKQDTCRLMIGSLGADSHEICRFNIEKGVWFKIRYVIKWSMENDGFIITYFNDSPVTPWNGTNYKYFTPTVYNEVGNYFKVGQYIAYPTYIPTSTYIDVFNIGN